MQSPTESGALSNIKRGWRTLDSGRISEPNWTRQFDFHLCTRKTGGAAPTVAIWTTRTTNEIGQYDLFEIETKKETQTNTWSICWLKQTNTNDVFCVASVPHQIGPVCNHFFRIVCTSHCLRRTTMASSLKVSNCYAAIFLPVGMKNSANEIKS